MKFLNYSMWTLFFTHILQIVTGHVCPNISTINTKIAKNESMRISMKEIGAHLDRSFIWYYRDHNNQIEDFYTGEREAEKITSVFFFKKILPH